MQVTRTKNTVSCPFQSNDKKYFPKDVELLILGYLTGKELLTFGVCSKYCQQLSKAQILWKGLYLRKIWHWYHQPQKVADYLHLFRKYTFLEHNVKRGIGDRGVLIEASEAFGSVALLGQRKRESILIGRGEVIREWNEKEEAWSPSVYRIPDTKICRLVQNEEDSIYVSSTDGNIFLWKRGQKNSITQICQLPNHPTSTIPLSTHQFFGSSLGGTVCVWDIDQQKPIFEQVTSPWQYSAIKIRNSANTIISGVGNSFYLWDSRQWNHTTTAPIEELYGKQCGNPWSLLDGEDNTFFSAHSSDAIIHWDMRMLRPIRTFHCFGGDKELHRMNYNLFSVFQNRAFGTFSLKKIGHQTLVSGHGNGMLRIWDITNGTQIHEIPPIRNVHTPFFNNLNRIETGITGRLYLGYISQDVTYLNFSRFCPIEDQNEVSGGKKKKKKHNGIKRIFGNLFKKE